MYYSNMLCKVSDCKYGNKHFTLDHVCGKCNKRGHGQIECGNEKWIQTLHEDTKNDELKTDFCTSSGCEYKKYHRDDGHMCAMCNQIHIFQLCPVYNKKLFSIVCPSCKKNNDITPLNALSLSANTQLKCNVCTKNDVTIHLPCGCTILCNGCFDKLKIL